MQTSKGKRVSGIELFILFNKQSVQSFNYERNTITLVSYPKYNFALLEKTTLNVNIFKDFKQDK